MKKSFFILVLSICFSAFVEGQGILQKQVSVNYEELPLQIALADLDQRYGFTFSYSSDLIQVDIPVSAYFEQVALSIVLDAILEGTGIDYAEMNGLILLRDKPQLSTPVSSRGESVGTEAAFEEEIDEILAGTPPWKDPNILIRPLTVSTPGSVSRLPVKRELPQPDWAILNELKFSNEEGPAVLQMSVLPYVGNYMEESDEVSANVSINLIWGVTGGIQGLEVGTLVNVTQGQMNGFQLSGASNVVTGPMQGFQMTGGANISEERSVGLQLAGVANYSRILQGVQIATAFNVVAWRGGGLQVAGLGNYAGGNSSAITQVSGLLNINRGTSGFQAATMLNVSKDVSVGQLALLNIGREVEGFQLGLINIADTVTGPSIGLLNIVKRGYNRFDLSSSEVLWLQSGWALGSPHFYNLIQFGYRGGDGRASASWGLGYGVGTRLFTTKRWLSNVEVFAWHINEEAFWTKEMNWLGQVRVLFEKENGWFRHLYFGPVFNISASRLNATENGIEGTKLAPYNLFEPTATDTNIKAWVGINAGFRF